MESYVCLGFCLQGLAVVEIFSQNFHYLGISHSALIFSEIYINVAHKPEQQQRYCAGGVSTKCIIKGRVPKKSTTMFGLLPK